MKRYLEKIKSVVKDPELIIYEETYLQAEGLRIVRGSVNGFEKLIVDGARAFRYEGEIEGGPSGIRICPLNDHNCERLDIDFPYRKQ